MTRFTILVVDDTPENIDIFDGILRNTYTVKVATNGLSALKLATSSPPDMIVLNVMMHGMDGFEVCRKLKNDIRTRNIPVIFVTALDEEMDEKRGAVDYITKPIRPEIAKTRIKTQLAIHAQEKMLEEKVRERTQELEDTRLEIIRKLGLAAEYKDNKTGLHVIRMSKYAKSIALSYGLDAKSAELILNAAPMHDIGKIGIPDNVLLKPGKLDKEEWKIMMTHAVIGADIIGEHSSPLLQEAKTGALTHHEKYNGKGYPNGISGEDIPLIGRILAIADVFDALTSVRPYKDAWPAEKAIALIEEESGQHFDPNVVEAFISSLPDILKVKKEFKD